MCVCGGGHIKGLMLQVTDQGQYHAVMQWHFKVRHQMSQSQVLISLEAHKHGTLFQSPNFLIVFCPKCSCLFPRRPGYWCSSCWCRVRQVDVHLISIHILRTGWGCSTAWENLPGSPPSLSYPPLLGPRLGSLMGGGLQPEKRIPS